ncbi:hypothetical protein Y032_0040g274 [Ancylostoma ceylanicum]|uniref:C-type lectin domain-containing protein n=1 Tax=Ancylostoma ceylanicum TaxID=53326 RepID=A0A016UJ62_9BILA|nr:hypothetical protein Y032_0040g274 [Ancylostoma ceylanicum]
MLLVVLLLFQIDTGVHASCSCSGIEVTESEQKHCWEVHSRAATTWVDADMACQRIGGHLGHPQGDTALKVYAYVKATYTKPVLTGIIAGSAQAKLYAIMCPNNKYHGLLPENTTFFQDPTDTDTCAYLTSQSEKLSFAPCTQDANVLCDRPMEKVDYCNIKMNCTTATTTTTAPILNSTSTTTTTTTTTTLPFNVSLNTSTTTTTLPVNVSLNTSTTTTTLPVIVSLNTSTSTTTSLATTVTTTTILHMQGNNPDTSSKTSCGRHEWNIFGWCMDWRLFLIFLAILLGIFLLICLLHCCCKLCVDPCQVKEKKKKEEEVPKKTKDIKDAPIPVPVPAEKSSLRKLPEPPPENKRYETEQPTAILPPPATVTQPVFVPIPVHDRRESLVKEVEREIRVVAPPKPETVDVGVNTDPWPPEKKRKVKKVDKVQVRQAPVVHSPLVEVDGDLADDVSVHLERWHSAETVIPKGDVPDTTPFVFIRNPKPKGTPKEPPRATSAPFVAEPDCQEEEKPQENPPAPASMPRRFRSPPPAENSAPPSKRTIRSPPAAKRPGPKLRRIPSPPRENVERGRSAEKVPEENNDSPPQIPPKRTRSQREVLVTSFSHRVRCS